MKKVGLMIFDFDGTLVRSGDDIAASLNYALRAVNAEPIEVEKVYTYIGDGSKKLIERALGPDAQDQYDYAYRIFVSHYHEHMMDSTILYNDVKEILNHFRKKTKIIITNKNYQFTSKIAEALSIKDYFDDIICADHMQYAKPDARLLEPLLKKYDSDYKRAVVFGDGINDILLAKNAGLLSCAFLNGLTDRDVLISMHPDYIYEDFSELRHLFY